LIFLVTGIQAAGKSTVSELLARRFERGVHVQGDVFRRMVVAGRINITPDESDEARRQLNLRYELGAATADAYCDAGFTVVVQDVILGDDLATYVARIRNRPLMVVVLAPRTDVVAAREADRDKTAYGPGGWTVEQLDVFLREQTARIGVWIDNSDQSADQTVDEILSRADEARV
jgi:cytidylate kinase